MQRALGGSEGEVPDRFDAARLDETCGAASTSARTRGEGICSSCRSGGEEERDRTAVAVADQDHVVEAEGTQERGEFGRGFVLEE